MEPETQAWIAGNFAGQKDAMLILVRLLHTQGTIDAAHYVQAIKETCNQTDAKFERQDYQYLQGLANSLQQWLDDPARPQQRG